MNIEELIKIIEQREYNKQQLRSNTQILSNDNDEYIVMVTFWLSIITLLLPFFGIIVMILLKVKL
jgi:hypothetical protein